MSSACKVLFICGYWKGSHGGGIRVFTENLYNNIHKGYQPKLIARWGSAEGPNEKIFSGNRLVFILKCLQFCLREKPALIHSHANWYCLFPGMLYRIFTRVKLIHSLHSVPEKRYSWLTRKIFYLMLKKAHHIHFVSKFLKDYYRDKEAMPFTANSVIYPGSDHASLKFSDYEKDKFFDKYSIPKNKRIILAQGLTAHRLKYQGALLLLTAFANLSIEFPDLVLLITRDGKYLPELKAKASVLNIHGKVIFTGDLDNPLIVYSIAEIYAHITLGEGGLSIALLESMATGNAIIATRVGGITELLDRSKSALLVEPQYQPVYDSLRVLLIDPDLQATLRSSARISAAKFTWMSTINQFQRLYKDILDIAC
jgi:L-malate glycosyltransferase